MYAVDIRSGNQTWVFDPSVSGSSEGHGVSFFDGVIYSTTSTALPHLSLAIDAHMHLWRKLSLMVQVATIRSWP